MWEDELVHLREEGRREYWRDIEVERIICNP